MNCVRCGSRLQPGQAQCSCGQYVDLPASEFYTRLENQVEKSSRDNFRRGFSSGLAFLPYSCCWKQSWTPFSLPANSS